MKHSDRTPAQKLIWTGLLILLLSGLVAAPAAYAQLDLSKTLAYQGYLTDADGNPLDGSVHLAFALYTSANGGTPQWEETQSNVRLDGGVFSVMLGSVEALGSVEFDRPYYLGVTVNGGDELAPRVALGAAPVSLYAHEVARGAAVLSINGLTNDVVLEAGNNVTLSEADGIITIDAEAAALALPFDGQVATEEPALKLTNTGTGVGLDITSHGEGALRASTTGDAISILASATGSAAALSALTSGSGHAGFFRQFNPESGRPALVATTNGAQSEAGHFSNTNAASESYALAAVSVGTGGAGRFEHGGPEGSAAHIKNTDADNFDPALVVETEGGTGMRVELSGDAGYAAEFTASSSNLAGGAIFARTNSANSAAVVASAQDGSVGIQALGSGTGSRPGIFTIFDAANDEAALEATTGGSGAALFAHNDGTGRAAHFDIPNANNNTDVFFAETDGGGTAGRLKINNAGNNKPALLAETNGTGTAARFLINNQNSTANGLEVTTFGTGTALLAVYAGAGAGDVVRFKKGVNNVARIDDTGRGYFNNGTQNSGADIAEAFAVEGAVAAYEAGDVLVISIRTDRTVERSAEPYSARVVGVYATKPGVLLTEHGIDEALDDTVPMGVVGVIPTKVSGENGPIRRGDLLVTSGTPGHAMKADPEALRVGTVLGKALANFEGSGTGLINVLVNVN